MDPAIANQDFDPPRQRILSPGLVPAVLIHLLLAIALAWGVNWKFGDERPSLSLPVPFWRTATSPPAPPRVPAADPDDTRSMGGPGYPPAANETARMGAAPAPSTAPVPAWPSAAVSSAATAPPQAMPAAEDPNPALRPMGQERVATPSASRQPERAQPAARPETRVPESRTQVAAVTPRPAPQTQAPAAAAPQESESRMQPSFDCAKARSTPERLICRDAELSRLDRELSRIHAQAKRAAADPQDFKRENDEEWRLREAVCRDKDCLLGWYAHRREQLQERLARSR
jgi:hypothetical protein